MDQNFINLANAYLQKLRVSEIPIASAFVFGSRVRGTANKWSDLDICVVSPIFGRDRQSERVRLMNLREGISDLIEPHPYGPEDFANRFDPVAQQVKLTGYRLV